jgi:O-antigen polymerase
VFFFVLQQFKLSNIHKQRLLWFIVIAVIIQVTLGYLQLFDLLPKEFLGYTTFTSKPFGVFQDPSVMVSFLSTGLVISGYLLARQQQKYGAKVSRTLCLYLVPFITAPLIIFLAQQLEWIGTIVGFVVVATYLYRFSTPQRLSGWISSSVAGAGLGLILFASSSVALNGSQTEHVDRSTLLSQSIDMFIEKPFTGYGYGKFESEYVLYSARQHQLNPNYPIGLSSIEHTQNETLFWGIEGGLVPVLAILIAVTMTLFKINSARKGTRLAIFSLFIPIVLHSQMGTPFYHSTVHWLVFIILLYWVDQRTSKYRNYKISKPSKILIRTSSFIIPTIVCSYMLLEVQANHTLLKFERSFPQKTAILDQAFYPGYLSTTYSWNRKKAALYEGLLSHQPELVNEYIDWSLQAIKVAPRERYYRNLIIAYLGLGEVSKANQIRSEASFLFPNLDFWTIAIDPIILPPAPESEPTPSEVGESIDTEKTKQNKTKQ